MKRRTFLAGLFVTPAIAGTVVARKPLATFVRGDSVLATPPLIYRFQCWVHIAKDAPDDWSLAELESLSRYLGMSINEIDGNSINVILDPKTNALKGRFAVLAVECTDVQWAAIKAELHRCLQGQNAVSSHYPLLYLDAADHIG